MSLKYISFFSIVFSIAVVLFLSFIPAFYEHLRVDIYGQYLANALVFLQNGNLKLQGYNEYQPIAVIFFITISPVLKLALQSDIYLTYVYTFYLFNILFIFINALLIYKITKNYANLLLFSTIILFTGPIILHRFELLLFIFNYLATYYFIRKKYLLHGFFISIAIFTKIFPIILVPYFLILIVRNRNRIENLTKTILGILTGSLFTLMVYVILLNVPLLKILQDLKIHAIKPVHAESLYATILTIYNYFFTNIKNSGFGRDGIFGINDSYIYLPLWFYNYFWIIPIFIAYLIFLFKNKNLKFNPIIPFFILVDFIVFSKILTAQYILWFTLFLPLLNIEKIRSNNTLKIIIVLNLTGLLITQYIYPLNYNVLLYNFFTQGNDTYIFWILVIRNFLISLIFTLCLYYLHKNTKVLE